MPDIANQQNLYSKRPKFRAKYEFADPCFLCSQPIKRGDWTRFYGQKLVGYKNVWVHYACFVLKR